ncbi:ABC transporter substrate-binding protein [Nonomuraea longispora]|uniref:ABC transporter substrate-binding protein n=1 Tax=Nonomuraea longispora TaxID=1848320 RepID=UPI00319D8D2C
MPRWDTSSWWGPCIRPQCQEIGGDTRFRRSCATSPSRSAPGPFRFKSWTPGRSVVLTRNPGYWEGAPQIEELEFLIANEESARINAAGRAGGVRPRPDVGHRAPARLPRPVRALAPE